MRAPDYSLCIAALLCAVWPSAAVAQQTRTIAVEAGPIWSQSDAQRKCAETAKANGGIWNGQWRTTVPGRMSICEIRLTSNHKDVVENVEAGPIWSQTDAEKKCPNVASANGAVWTGRWHTTVPGRMSVCELRFR